MDWGGIDQLAQWLADNPWAAGAIIFLIAFGDAVILLGVIIPALPLLFAVGALVGTGHINGTYAIACAALGAFAGDGLSFWVGHRFGPALRQRWPFARYPEWIERSEVMFRRHGAKAILIARYVGAVRPFVPAIAGMLKVPLRRYVPASALAAVLWSITFLLPGWLFGTSLELFAAIAGRLVILLGLLVGVLALIWATVVFLWRRLAPRTNQMLTRFMLWSQRHPALSRWSSGLVDPRRPESPSLLLLAVLLLLALWGFATVLIAVTAGGAGPLTLDHRVHDLMLSLRNPLADSAMALAAAFGDWPVLLPTSTLVFGWLLWRRRIAAWHWLAAIAFGLASTALVGQLLHLPRPPAAANLGGFGFPSTSITLVVVVFGFFAVLIARELPGRRRVWPYVVAGLVTGLVAFARLYLGANWLSDVLGGALFGLSWVAILGLAYRRRVLRSFWIRPLVLIFFGSLLASAWWYGPSRVEATLTRFTAMTEVPVGSREHWWNAIDAGPVPVWRNELEGQSAWPLNVQLVGDPEGLAERLSGRGWTRAEPGGWQDLLMTLNDDATPETLRILPASHYGRAQVLMLTQTVDGQPSARRVLRFWRTGYRLDDGTPIWLGNVQTLHFSQYRWLHYWRLENDAESALAQLVDDTQQAGVAAAWRGTTPAVLRVQLAPP